MDVECGWEWISKSKQGKQSKFIQQKGKNYWFYFGYTGTDKKLLLIFPIRCGFCEGGVIPGYFTLNGMLRL